MFETTERTLQTLPHTRLAKLSPDDPSYYPAQGEYFFDRNPRLFPYVLDAYREGELHFPRCVCGPAVREELAWWGLGEEILAPCCLQAVAEWEEEKQTLAVIDAAYGGVSAQLPENGRKTSSWRQRAHALWVFLEDPYSSRAARVSGFIVSVVVFFILHQVSYSITNRLSLIFSRNNLLEIVS